MTRIPGASIKHLIPPFSVALSKTYSKKMKNKATI
jgi:hypothetical protein